jgi:hypothetical protein
MEANVREQPQELVTFRRGMAFMLDLQAGDTADLQHFLLLSKNRFSKDPRDRIYGFLGILETLSGRSLMQVDYKITVCELYMHVCRVLYNESESLDFLSMVERNRAQNGDSNLDPPSWSPNWTVKTNMSPVYQASHPPAWSSSNPRPRALSEQFAFTGEGVTRYGHRTCWRPPSAEVELQSCSFWDARLSHVYALATPVESPPVRDGENRAPKLEPLVFTTDAHQCRGMTDAAIKTGDVICALFGGKVPYILRNRQNSWTLAGQQ